MAAEPNAGFHREGTLIYAPNRHATPFRSAAIGSTSGMISMVAGGGGGGGYFGMSSSNSSGMILPIHSSSTGIVQAQAGNSSLLVDSFSGLKHDTGFAVEWSVEEQHKLEEGLEKYADQPNIMRYIKIAATLRDKTVRDVALRCRWMTRKRRKAEEYNAGKKVISRKDKLVVSSPKMNTPSIVPQNMAVHPLMMLQMDQSGSLAFEGISGTTRHLLEQNAQAFNKITANLSSFKLQDNIDLFCRTRNNITAILNEMGEMPGIMSQMPPLSVSINEDLVNSILPNITQPMIFGSPSGFQLKQEPRC